MIKWIRVVAGKLLAGINCPDSALVVSCLCCAIEQSSVRKSKVSFGCGSVVTEQQEASRNAGEKCRETERALPNLDGVWQSFESSQ